MLTTYADPVFDSLPVSAIDTALVMRVLEPKGRHQKPELSAIFTHPMILLVPRRIAGHEHTRQPRFSDRWRLRAIK
ncbi:hypothetical protein [Paraburkholderia azotifigens]|uniref:Uncharacterized protein n=1 Tax=Paraburkholderia azotifigens TaxID=2057004 RepID=A0A5C6VVF7_9BURK|nr:hypothetical protein [Paraburkholderia azotifigens]TXC87438.1 hypothetical protein FRZ40_07570 [Paraburkholderia azotifigens]